MNTITKVYGMTNKQAEFHNCPYCNTSIRLILPPCILLRKGVYQHFIVECPKCISDERAQGNPTGLSFSMYIDVSDKDGEWGQRVVAAAWNGFCNQFLIEQLSRSPR